MCRLFARVGRAGGAAGVFASAFGERLADSNCADAAERAGRARQAGEVGSGSWDGIRAKVGRQGRQPATGFHQSAEGVAMKRFALIVGAVLGLLGGGNAAKAGWGALTYSGYQPWYNIFAKRNKCLTPEEERLQKFWHDYYHALKGYYADLDHIDWVAYYKNHGYQINAGCGAGGCCGRINYAPVFVSPTMQ